MSVLPSVIVGRQPRRRSRIGVLLRDGHVLEGFSRTLRRAVALAPTVATEASDVSLAK